MVINIGDTNSKIIISDNATPNNGTYAWYLTPDESAGPPMSMEALRAVPRGNVSSIDSHTIIPGFFLEEVYTLSDIIRNATDYNSLLDAKDYWKQNKNLLYLSLKNEWGVNLATTGSASNPTTQTQLTGVLNSLKKTFKAHSIIIRIKFAQCTISGE